MILVIVLVLFGSTKIPKLARSLGEASKEFKKGIEEGESAGSNPAPAKAASIAEPESTPTPMSATSTHSEPGVASGVSAPAATMDEAGTPSQHD